MDPNAYEQKQHEWQKRCVDELNQAPEEFQQAFALLDAGDTISAEKAFARCTLSGIWLGNSQAILGFLSKENGDYESAITFAREGRRLGLTLIGYDYYYSTLTAALNHTDRLAECVTVIDEAIDYFTRQDSQPNLANHSAHKANVLKQLAAPLSLSVERHSNDEAKRLIIDAIRCICTSLAITSFGWEVDLRPELESIAGIAGRSGVRRGDLQFLEELPELQSLIDEFFTDVRLVRTRASEMFNLAQRAKKAGNREDAALWFERAVENAPIETEMDKAWRAFVAYQAGVNLFVLNNLEDPEVRESDEPRIQSAVNAVRAYWNHTLSLSSELDRETVTQFDKEFSPGLAVATQNIAGDSIMSPHASENPFIEPALKLIGERRYAEAVPLLEKAMEISRTTGILVALATALKETGHFRRGLELLREAASNLDDSEIEAKGTIWYNYANSLREQGQAEEAIPWYQKAIALRSGHAGQHFNLGQCYFLLGQFQLALEQYEYILSHINPIDPEALDAAKFARTLSKEGSTMPLGGRSIPEGSLPTYKWRDPNAAQCYSDMLRLALDGVPDVADDLERLAAEVVRREPENEQAMFWTLACQAHSYLSFARQDDALATAAIAMGQRALEVHQTRPLAREQLWLLYDAMAKAHFYRDDDYADTEKYCRLALEIEPESEGILAVLEAIGRKPRSPQAVERPEQKKACFVATAVYESPDAVEVEILRRFRDRVLLPSRIGRLLVRAYYEYSPAAARIVQRSPVVRSIVRRLILDPLVQCCNSVRGQRGKKGDAIARNSYER